MNREEKIYCSAMFLYLLLGISLGFIFQPSVKLQVQNISLEVRSFFNEGFALNEGEYLTNNSMELYIFMVDYEELITRGNIEKVTAKEANLVGRIGLYAGGNTFYTSNLSNNHITGHEICHLILRKNGFNVGNTNEDICYTIEHNYDFRGYDGW